METATMNDMVSLAGRTVIVTGAGQGIGQAIARQAHQLGANVAIVDVNADAASAVAGTLGERAIAWAGSVADPDFAGTMVSEAVARFGQVDGLVNNAGIVRPAMIEKMTLDQWRQVLDVHLTGSFLFLQAVGRHLLERAKGGERAPGAIVNISSDAGRKGSIGQINYAAAKSGVLGLTMSAAREWAKYEIRVNTLCFGVVETPMTDVIRSEKFRDSALAQIPMGRWAQPEESATAACFLLSTASSYITGQHIGVNGGYHITS
jgi:3-oxoacyl-[acyl-carrier protein] reductase